MISKIKNILSNQDKFKLNFILFLNFLTFFTEFISIASIPIFVVLIIDSSFVLEKLESYSFIYFSNLNHIEIVKIFGIIIIGIFLIKNILLFVLIDLTSRFVKKIKLDISSKLLKKYLFAPFDYHLKNNPALLTRNTTESVEGLSVYLAQTINMLRECLALLVLFTLLVIVNPVVTVSVTTLFFLLSVLYVKIFRPIIKNKSERNEDLKVNLIQMINETFGAIKDIKILNKEKDVLKFYNHNRQELERNIFHFTYLERSPRLILEVLSILLITISTIILLNLSSNTTTLLSLLSLIVISVVRFIPAFNSIITSITYIRLYTPSVNILLKELNQNIELLEANQTKINSLIVNKKKDFIYLNNVSFSYPDEKKDILKKINFEIKEGIKLGITGETGAGKSTLFHLMLGLLKPDTGDIYFNNKSIYHDLNNWRNKIGYIAQNIYLLDATIEKNISFDFLNEKVDKKRLEFSIEMACLKNKILELPNGINTQVGNDGIKLSGGEKQRVALARAIYRNPSILFMDESTSALDNQTEQKIIDNIKTYLKEKTMIMIAHRHTTIKDCDQIINLKNGVLEN